MSKEHPSARKILRKCLASGGMSEYEDRITFIGRYGQDQAKALCYYYEHPTQDTALCQIVRSILFDQIPELYQVLK